MYPNLSIFDLKIKSSEATSGGKTHQGTIELAKFVQDNFNIRHFSAFNEMNEDVFEEFDLKDLVSESVDYFNDISITKNIQINSNLLNCFIKMDKTKTQKLVNNLISNAIKYSYKDSIIKVTLEDNILSIKDFGMGIIQEEQKEIFKRCDLGY